MYVMICRVFFLGTFRHIIHIILNYNYTVKLQNKFMHAYVILNEKDVMK